MRDARGLRVATFDATPVAQQIRRYYPHERPELYNIHLPTEDLTIEPMPSPHQVRLIFDGKSIVVDGNKLIEAVRAMQIRGSRF